MIVMVNYLGDILRAFIRNLVHYSKISARAALEWADNLSVACLQIKHCIANYGVIQPYPPYPLGTPVEGILRNFDDNSLRNKSDIH